MIIPPSYVDAALLRHDDHLAAAARARLVTAATRPVLPATPRPAGRVRAGLRQVVASLVAFAAIG